MDSTGPTSPVTGGKRIVALDGARGLAILAVMLGHMTDYGGLRPLVPVDKAYHAIASLGGLGVDLFFVLSGFLITGILLDSKGCDGYFRTFYARRVLRIFPVYYAFLFVVFVILPRLTPAGSPLRSVLPEQGWYWSYLANYRIAATGWPVYGGIGHFWSLAVEEQFYLFWPIPVFLLGRPAFRALCVALVVAGPLVRLAMWWHGLPAIANVAGPARVDALALGALIAVLVREKDGLALLHRWARPAGVASAVALTLLLILFGGWNTKAPVIPIGGRSLTILASAGLIALALRSPERRGAGRLFSHPVLVFFGTISYGLYVVHPPLLILLRDLGLSASTLPAIFGSRLPGQILFIAVGGAASTAIAWASWRWFESPILRWKSRFPYERVPVSDRRPRAARDNVVAMRRPDNPLTRRSWSPGAPERRSAQRSG